jgi:monofunctional biosynthetic peptidoglycan transglycosylase
VQHYFKKPAARLGPLVSAHLAVMLPRPKFFEKVQGFGYLADRSATFAVRVGGAELP